MLLELKGRKEAGIACQSIQTPNFNTVTLLLSFSCYLVLDCLATPWSVDHQALLSMGFSGQEYWYVLPFPTSGDLPHLGLKPVSPALADVFLSTVPPRKP